MHTSGSDEHQGWNMEKKCITWLLFVPNGLHFLSVFSNACYVQMPPQDFFIFAYEMLCRWFISGMNLVGTI